MLLIIIIKSFGFPSKKVTPIGKFNGTRNNVAKSFLTRLDGNVFQSYECITDQSIPFRCSISFTSTFTWRITVMLSACFECYHFLSYHSRYSINEVRQLNCYTNNVCHSIIMMCYFMQYVFFSLCTRHS